MLLDSSIRLLDGECKLMTADLLMTDDVDIIICVLKNETAIVFIYI